MLMPNPILQFGKRNGLWLPRTSAEIVQTNLTVQMKHDEGTGDTLTDYKSGYNGQLGSDPGADSRDPTWNATGLTYSSDYVSMTTAIKTGLGTGSFTLFIVFKNTSYAVARGLIEAISGLDNLATVLDTSQHVNVYLTPTGLSKITATSTKTLGTGWNLVAIRFTSGTNPTLQIWEPVSGAMTKTADQSASGTSSTWNQGSTYRLGSSNNNSYFLIGDTAYLLGYNTDISDANLETNYQALKTILAARSISL